MFIVYDTETNGKIKDWRQRANRSNNFPRIVQIAFAYFDENAKLIDSESLIIKPNGWTISPESQEVHGITMEYANEHGIDLEVALKMFGNYHCQSLHQICHNVVFDRKVVQCELMRCDIQYDMKEINSICTMQKSRKECGLIKNGRKSSPPKLNELHYHLFGESMSGNAHDAMDDVLATAKCFFELLKRGVIQL